MSSPNTTIQIQPRQILIKIKNFLTENLMIGLINIPANQTRQTGLSPIHSVKINLFLLKELFRLEELRDSEILS